MGHSKVSPGGFLSWSGSGQLGGGNTISATMGMGGDSFTFEYGFGLVNMPPVLGGGQMWLPCKKKLELKKFKKY